MPIIIFTAKTELQQLKSLCYNGLQKISKFLRFLLRYNF